MLQEAQTAAGNGIRMYAVGLGGTVSDNFLSQVVFSPAVRNANYWQIGAYESLRGRVFSIATSICSFDPLLEGTNLHDGKVNAASKLESRGMGRQYSSGITNHSNARGVRYL